MTIVLPAVPVVVGMVLVYILGACVTAPFVLRWRMNQLVEYKVQEPFAKPGYSEGFTTQGLRVAPRGTVQSRTTDDAKYAAKWGLLWPIWLVRYTVELVLRMMIRYTPDTKAEKAREEPKPEAEEAVELPPPRKDELKRVL